MLDVTRPLLGWTGALDAAQVRVRSHSSGHPSRHGPRVEVVTARSASADEGLCDTVSGQIALRRGKVHHSEVALTGFTAPTKDGHVPLCLTPRIERIAQSVTGRRESLFAGDVAKATAELKDALDGKRVLLVGAAGSIGSATLIEMLKVAKPATVAVLDPNENNLAELVRSIRNLSEPFIGELIVQPLDYGTPLTTIFLRSQKPFHVVMNFAALKHVRSERDEFSITRMLEVNLLKADYFLSSLRQQPEYSNSKIFFVSTDKAANPVGIMGASKRAMELLIWAHSQVDQYIYQSKDTGESAPKFNQVTSARFANVAFSDGSLPWAFLQRLEKRQPLAAPSDIRRFLISPTEAGQLCLLASCRTAHSHLVIPRLTEKDLVSFVDIAVKTLEAYGLEPAFCDDPEVARRSVASELGKNRYPVLKTISDTSGEKETEEFVAREEIAKDHPNGVKNLEAISAPKLRQEDIARLEVLLHGIHRAVLPRGAHDVPDKIGLIAAISKTLAAIAPGFHHRETGKSLDGKM